MPLCPAGHAATPHAVISASLLYGISRLPETQGDKAAKKKFKSYPIGYVHIDIAEVRTEEGKLYLFVAIDRTSKFAYAELHEKANHRIAAGFLKALIKAVPYKIAHRQRHSVHRSAKEPRWAIGSLAGAYVRHALRCKRHRAQTNQAKASLDQWSG